MNQDILKWSVRLGFILVMVMAYLFIPAVQNEIKTATKILANADIKGMKEYLAGFGIWGPIVSMGLMILQALAAPLPAFVITFANAWIWGWAFGAVISWTGAMIGATICFYLAKWFGRPLVEKMVGGKTLELTDKFFDRYGKYTVIIARLIPVVPFDPISYAAGLTNMSLRSFLIATGVGQLPATIVYSYLGENISSGAKYGFMVFSAVLALLILSMILKKRMENRLLTEGESSEL
ncbi:MAG: TVP38/TMEM64 family protein [Clostridia bacterium]|nr:TVP38/TMEM64 family protein [Clostridia bacterium]